MIRSLSLTACLTLLATAPVSAQTCGGDFGTFIDGLKSEARAMGISAADADGFFRTVSFDQDVINADRRQGIFQRDFLDFSQRLISANRMQNGATNAQRYDAVFDAIEAQYGVQRGVLLAFWALETDFGAVQGDFNTADALVTLSYDCRRPELFRPQVLAAIKLYARGDFDPATTTGAWAGEIGMVQMLPGDILENGVDADGDGLVSLKTSAPDALFSGANMLRDLGWRRNEPWLQEIVVPAGLDMALTGLDQKRSVRDWQALGITARTGALGAGNLEAAVLLPMGQNGPAFIAYPNFEVYFEWNQSLTYVTTAAYFATRLMGAPVYDAGTPDPGLSGDEMRLLQQKLSNMGYDVGGIDGILGAMTRAAVKAEQQRLGFPADSWPTRALLDAL